MWVVLKKTTTKQCQNLQLQLVECTLPMLLAKKKTNYTCTYAFQFLADISLCVITCRSSPYKVLETVHYLHVAP